MALDRSVGEGGVLKFAHLKKFACLTPPSGVMRQHALSFQLIWIRRLTLSYGPKNQNTHFTGLCSMGDQSCKKTRKLHLAVSARKWARVAHLQRHLSANGIKLIWPFSKFAYYAGPSVKLPKMVAVTFQNFL